MRQERESEKKKIGENMLFHSTFQNVFLFSLSTILSLDEKIELKSLYLYFYNIR